MTNFLEQNFEELIIDVYGTQKLDDVKKMFDNNNQTTISDDYHIHIDSYIVGGSPRTKQILCSGVSSHVRMFDSIAFGNGLYCFNYDQVKKLKIHCASKQDTAEIKKKILDSILEAGTFIDLE